MLLCAQAMGIEYVDEFFLTSGSKRPSLMDLPFAIQEIEWERPTSEKVYVQGRSDGQDVSVEIDLWRLELPVEGKPKFLVHQTSGAWQVNKLLTTVFRLFWHVCKVSVGTDFPLQDGASKTKRFLLGDYESRCGGSSFLDLC